MRAFVAFLALSFVATRLPAAEPTAAERGYKALTRPRSSRRSGRRRRTRTPGSGGGVTEKPADYDAAFRDRYGLHPAPYPNDGLPMGLREARPACSARASAIDCMLCHGGSILGQELRRPRQHLARHPGAVRGPGGGRRRSRGKLPFTFSNVRGTTEAGGVRRLPARLPQAGPEPRSSTAQDLGPARRPVRGRAGVVAAEEEEDHVPHRRRPTPARSGRSCSS